MEVFLQVHSRVAEIVHERSLLDELVLVVNPHVFQLSLGLLEELVL